MSDGGKGDKPRPLSVDREEFDNRFETIFGKREPRKPYVYEPKELDDARAEDEEFERIRKQN
jgi:hypothetical protein